VLGSPNRGISRVKHRFAHDAHVAHRFPVKNRARVVRKSIRKTVGIVGNVGRIAQFAMAAGIKSGPWSAFRIPPAKRKRVSVSAPPRRRRPAGKSDTCVAFRPALVLDSDLFRSWR